MQFIYKVTYFIPITIALPMQCCINWATIIKISLHFNVVYYISPISSPSFIQTKRKKRKVPLSFKALTKLLSEKVIFFLLNGDFGNRSASGCHAALQNSFSRVIWEIKGKIDLGFLKHLNTSQNINHNTEDNIYTQSEWGANRAKQQQAVFYPSESAVSSGSSCDTRIQTCQHGHEHNTWRAQHSQSREVRYKCTESQMCSCSFSTCTHTPHTTGARRMANMCQRLDQSMYFSCVMAVWNDTYRNTKGWPLDLMTSWQVLSVLLLRVFVPVISQCQNLKCFSLNSSKVPRLHLFHNSTLYYLKGQFTHKSKFCHHCVK